MLQVSEDSGLQTPAFQQDRDQKLRPPGEGPSLMCSSAPVLMLDTWQLILSTERKIGTDI